MKKPKPKDSINVSQLLKVCEKYIDFFDTYDTDQEDEIDDYEHEIFEKALETIYGKNVWEFINYKLI